VQAKVREGSSGGISGTTRVGFVKHISFKLEVKKEGAMDEQIGESEKEEVMGEGTGESKMEELVPEEVE